jgi:hypothetical protein
MEEERRFRHVGEPVSFLQAATLNVIHFFRFLPGVNSWTHRSDTIT